MKVLFHVDVGSRWTMALGNIRNLLQYGRDTGTTFEIELVVNGPAVMELRPAAAEDAGLTDLFEVLAPDVRICACNNALKSNGIPPQELFPFVQVVPAGVAELVVRQQDGYAYILSLIHI